MSPLGRLSSAACSRLAQRQVFAPAASPTMSGWFRAAWVSSSSAAFSTSQPCQQVTILRQPTGKTPNNVGKLKGRKSGVEREAKTGPVAARNAPGESAEGQAERVNRLRTHLEKGSDRAYGRLNRATYVPDASSVQFTLENHPLPLSVSTFWLRDSCHCPHCVTPSSGQKQFQTADLPGNPEVKRVEMVEDAGPGQDGAPQGPALRVEWAETTVDGSPHVSTYSQQTLLFSAAQMVHPVFPALPERRLWDRARLERELRPVSFQDWTAGGEEFYRGLTDLHQLGIVIVDGVPEAETSVLDVAHQIGPIMNTFYGETWNVVSKPAAENVAYTNEFLCLHQDLLYMAEPPYIQLLHCLQNDADGGESLFSDSVRAAWEMQLAHPDQAAALTKVQVPYHYERNGHYYFQRHPVIENAPGTSHMIRQTAWSPPFQDSFYAGVCFVDALNPGGDVPRGTFLREKWLPASKTFKDLVESPANMYEVKMQPGQCVLFNNRRVLHGRRQFNTASGSRWLKGTYLAEQVFTSKLMGMLREKKYLPPDYSPFPGPRAQERHREVRQVRRMLGGQDPQKTEPDQAEPVASDA